MVVITAGNVNGVDHDFLNYLENLDGFINLFEG
ncbi:MAG: hypothetical protein ACI8ZB_005353 [Desulforhopalus sp.]|jgi:hypothetical protein